METTQKALSIKQPWAYLIASGIKDIENRTWKCPEEYIGQRVLIHASAKPIDKFSQCLTKPQDFEFKNKSNIPYDYNKNLWVYNQLEYACKHDTGSIIGSVEIVDCVVNHPSVWAELSKGYTIDRTLYPNGISIELIRHKENVIYNWVLANPILFDEPILNVKGMLGFWKYIPEINPNEVLSTK